MKLFLLTIKKIAEIQSQLTLAEWIQEKLNKESKNNDVLPTNLGFTDLSITSSIQRYNELVQNKKVYSKISGISLIEREMFDIEPQNVIFPNCISTCKRRKRKLLFPWQ